MARMTRMARMARWLADCHYPILIALPFVFSPPFSEHRLQEYSKYRAYQTLLKITHR